MKKIIILVISLFLSYINLYSIDIVEQFTISGNNLKLFKVSSDYKYFYTIDDSNHYCIWDAHTHELLTQKSFTFTYNSIDVSDDGKYVFYDVFSDYCSDPTTYNALKWDIEKNNVDTLYVKNFNNSWIVFGKVKSIPNSEKLSCSVGLMALSGGSGGTDEFVTFGYLYLLNYITGEEIAIITKQEGSPLYNPNNFGIGGDNMNILAFNKDNSIIISNMNSAFSWIDQSNQKGGESYSKTYIIKNDSIINSLPFNASLAAISLDNNYLATSNDSLQIWTLDSLKYSNTIHSYHLSSLLFSNNSKYLITASPLLIYNINTGSVIDTLLSNQNVTGTMLFRTDDSLKYLLVDTKGHCTIFSYIKNLDTLIPSFNYLDTIGTFPLSVRFKDASNGNIKVWKWNFGDGEYSTEKNPIHTYKLPGIYSVKLVVSDLNNIDSIIKKDIIIVRGFEKDSLYSLDTLWTLKSDLSTFKPLEYSPDSKLIYTSDYNRNIRVFKSINGILYKSKDLGANYYTVHFSYDKKYMSINNCIRYFDADTNLKCFTVTLGQNIFPDLNLGYSKYNEYSTYFFKHYNNILTFQRICMIETWVNFKFNGTAIMEDFHTIFNLNSSSSTKDYIAITPVITQFEFSPNENYFAGIGYYQDYSINYKSDEFSPVNISNYISIFKFTGDLNTGSVSYDTILLKTNYDSYYDCSVIAFSRDSRSVYIGSLDSVLYHKDIILPDSDVFDYKYPAPITAMKFSMDGRYIITGHSTGDLYIYDLIDKTIVDHCKLPSKVIAIDVSPDSTQFVVGTEDGYLWCFKSKYITNTQLDVKEPSIIQDIKAEVLPNPAYDEATIRYTLNRQSSIQIEIYNSLGERVMKIDEGLQTEDRHDCTININNLNSGMYYYRLIADGNVATGVMAVVK